MNLDAGMSAAAILVVFAAVPAVVAGARGPWRGTWRRVPGGATAGRGALRLMICAQALVVTWFVVAAGLDAAGAGAHMLGLAGSIAVPIATIGMLGGIERIPGVVESADGRLRWRLDVLLVALTIFLSGWLLTVIVGNGARQFDLHPGWALLGSTLPVLAATLAVAFGFVLVLRLVTRQRALATLTAGGVLTSLGGAITVIGVYADHGSKVLAGGTVTAVGLVTLGWCVDRYADLLEPPVAERRSGWLLPMVTVGFALVMIFLEVVFTGSLDAVASVFGVMTGFALVSRQGLALTDARTLSQQLRLDEVHLRRMAFTDSLTGVANRRELLRVLSEEAVGGPPCVLLAIDLDGFKNVNDLRGHDVGDAVLREVARRLRETLRAGDLVARMGGDEFAVLMWDRLVPARDAAVRLLDTLAQPYETDSGSVFVSASIGLAAHESAPDIAGLLRNADVALRFAKARGKNRIEPYDRQFDDWFHKRTLIEHELRGAIERAELHLVFQPVVALPGGAVVGAEALLRWTHPRLGVVPPDEFIPIAEESGLIAALDHWVLRHACAQLASWIADGYDLWLAVNISARELHLVDYVGKVLGTASAYGVPADRLVLEITEHALAVDPDEMIVQLDTLREAGVRIALDDFGAGYSSLGQLRTLPVDILKIDRSLVGDPRWSGTRESRPLVDVVVQLGRRLGLRVIAEGVSVDAERTVVEAAGCRLGQGDLFGPAMAAEMIDKLLASGGHVTIPRPRNPAVSTPPQ